MFSFKIEIKTFFLGRRNPLRMLSNAMDFRSRKRGSHRPKSADFERVSENPAGKCTILMFSKKILHQLLYLSGQYEMGAIKTKAFRNNK